MQPLQGSFVALVTPMSPGGGIDFHALEALIEWHVESGTNGIVSVGTTGESATVSVAEHIEIIEKTIYLVDGRVPVIAGTGGNSTQEAIELTQTASKLGADYALIVTPYYNKPNQEGLFKHFIKIADSVDIPQILYNVPSRTACDLRPETVSRLANHQNIVGIKEALDSPERLAELVRISQAILDQKNFSILSGDDPSFNSFMAHGGDGVISVAANIIPKHISQICSLNLSKQYDDAKELDAIFKKLYELLFIESNPMPVKWMLYKMGRIQSGIRLPLVPFNEVFHEKTINEMIKLKLI
ncbi:MAG: 4-hydroxy-tetrahydrodipicolinate synthase [SAR86 cluster bacterium]|nr:4-hydroxy-tetrahydrodipicolinate synthase [SAR86 cluster bacterium]MDA9936064.1 4-hydroxy-tetrahydrodipicolinate synthase [Gammaproteobacteria bacterium]MDA9965170.1 4-hydroxy-tetrahydrodipicolinate synthase [Gammaproteobacteria bacterium]MDC0332530.1 4-hydroxy-tetrahydrodipicolinate synthase [Gammaproteobacteria bacterium]